MWALCVGTLRVRSRCFPLATCTVIHGAASAGDDGGDGGPLQVCSGRSVGDTRPPDIEEQQIDNPLMVNKTLSFLTYGTTRQVKGLNQFPKDTWPTNIPLLYFAYHIMVGLGTLSSP